MYYLLVILPVLPSLQYVLHPLVLFAMFCAPLPLGRPHRTSLGGDGRAWRDGGILGGGRCKCGCQRQGERRRAGVGGLARREASRAAAHYWSTHLGLSWPACARARVLSLQAGNTPLDLATGDARAVLEHHAAVLAAVAADPAALGPAFLAHLAALSKSQGVPAAVLPLRAYHLQPALRWLPVPTLAALGPWARDVAAAQLMARGPFKRESIRCRRMILNCLLVQLPLAEAWSIPARCSSPAAFAWVDLVVAAADRVSAHSSRKSVNYHPSLPLASQICVCGSNFPCWSV